MPDHRYPKLNTDIRDAFRAMTPDQWFVAFCGIGALAEDHFVMLGLSKEQAHTVSCAIAEAALATANNSDSHTEGAIERCISTAEKVVSDREVGDATKH